MADEVEAERSLGGC